MEEYIKKIREIEERDEQEKRKNKVENDECKHEFTSERGYYVCEKCGIMTDYCFDSFDLDHQRPYKIKRPYKAIDYLKKVLRKINGYFYPEKTDVEINNVPCCIREIRKYIKNNKLHKMNDIYYWRKKNNITETIPSNEQVKIVSAYMRQFPRKPVKTFVFQYLENREEFESLIPIVKKKKIISY